MKPNDFHSTETDYVVVTGTGHYAFVPAPPPSAIDYDSELVMALSRADARLSELSGLGRLLPNPHLLIDPYIRREAVLSSRIEGTRAGVMDVLVDEAERPTAKSEEDVREVRNYISALEYGRKCLAEGGSLSLQLVRELHLRLLGGVRGNHATPGEFRRTQNWIGSPGSRLDTARYVPPPVRQLQVTLEQWESFLQDRASHPELIHCALMHEYFEAIHPFADGNGRVPLCQ